MKISDIEDKLSNYLGKYLKQLLNIFSKIEQRDYNLDEDENKIVDINRLIDINPEDLRFLLDILNAINKINEININNILNGYDGQIQSPTIENYQEEIIKAGKELGIYDRDENKIFSQIKIMYQSRLIIMLISKMKKYFEMDKYDVFLSHSSIDAREVLGIKLQLLYEYRYKRTSYVDWLDDYYLNHFRAMQKITELLLECLDYDEKIVISKLEKHFVDMEYYESYEGEVIDKILAAIRNSDRFLYIDSKNSKYSKWMPYELGHAEAKPDGKIYRIIIHYRRKRGGISKYSNFLTKYRVIEEISDINFEMLLGV